MCGVSHVGDEANGPRRRRPTARRTLRAVTRSHRLLSAALTGAVSVLLAGCSSGDPQRDSSGAIAEPGQTRLLKLRAGDCAADLRNSFDDLDRGANGVPLVRAVPCSKPHDGEILQIGPIDGEQWPGYGVVNGEAARSRPALRQRLSAANVPGGVTLISFSPSKERWNFEGQHEIVYVALFAQPQRGALKAVSGGA